MISVYFKFTFFYKIEYDFKYLDLKNPNLFQKELVYRFFSKTIKSVKKKKIKLYLYIFYSDTRFYSDISILIQFTVYKEPYKRHEMRK